MHGAPQIDHEILLVLKLVRWVFEFQEVQAVLLNLDVAIAVGLRLRESPMLYDNRQIPYKNCLG